MSTTTYAVAGMSCQHCVTAVTGEVGKVSGVSDVAVDLASGTVTVTGQSVEDAAVREAIDEAGYEVTA